MFRRFWLRHVCFIHVTVVLAVITSLFAEGSINLTSANSRVGNALPFFAACPASCIENFDSVTAPTLPAGWTASIPTGLTGDLPWRTVNTTSDSAPNSAFASDPGHVTNNLLTSRTFPIASTALLTFRRTNNLEASFDGMVLEISIDGAAFTDILNAGVFTGGSYNGTIDSRFGNPLAGRQAWTGDTGGFLNTQVVLSSSVIGRTVAFRWRVGTDDSIAGVGAFIDNITLSGWTGPPANDNFANAQTISGVSGTVNGSNVGATREANEPNHAGSTGGASVWYRWQAPATASFVFTTYNSGFQTVLAVYSGNSFLGGSVAANDIEPYGCLPPFSSSPPFSRLSFNFIAGTVYNIAVDRRSNSASGNIVLRWGRSATISGGVRDVSGRPAQVDVVRLQGDTCRNSESQAGVFFTNVPTGGNYNVFLQGPTGYSYTPYSQNASISPLTGDVSSFSFYVSTPAYTISGVVTMPGGDVSNLTVMCVSTNGGLISRPANIGGSGNYTCAGLPAFGDYVVTPSKQGFNFVPPSTTITSLTQNTPFVNFTGALAPTFTISGRVTNPDSTGLSGVSMALSGSQTASVVSDLSGNYSFAGVVQGGNYTITPSKTNYSFAPPSQSFNNLGVNQIANFTATSLFHLILEESGQVAAADAMLGIRDPFPVINSSNFLNRGVDRNTRIAIFVSNLQLGPGGLPSSVVINLTGSNNQTYDVPAEDVRPVSNLGFSQITFRLPDTLTVGTCTLIVKASGQTSNIGAIRIRN